MVVASGPAPAPSVQPEQAKAGPSRAGHLPALAQLVPPYGPSESSLASLHPLGVPSGPLPHSPLSLLLAALTSVVS